MTDLIGGEADAWADIVVEAGACLHLYGKAENRPGRKMGHVTRLSPFIGQPITLLDNIFQNGQRSKHAAA